MIFVVSRNAVLAGYKGTNFSTCSIRSAFSPVITLFRPPYAIVISGVPRVVIFRPYFIWERKIFKSNGFFYKTCQAPNLYLTLGGYP